MLSRRTICGPVTACFHTPVYTVLPCQDTSFGIPTLTDNSTGARAGLVAPGSVVPCTATPVMSAALR